MRKLLEWLVVAGALKALIPSPGHTVEFGEFALAGVLATGVMALWRLYGTESREAARGDSAEAATDR